MPKFRVPKKLSSTLIPSKKSTSRRIIRPKTCTKNKVKKSADTERSSLEDVPKENVLEDITEENTTSFSSQPICESHTDSDVNKNLY